MRKVQYPLYDHDFAWPMGIGYQTRHTGLGIDLRYNYGLINIIKGVSDANIKNSVYQFDIYFLFGGKQ